MKTAKAAYYDHLILAFCGSVY